MKVLRLPKVVETTGIGHTKIYEEMERGTFPKPVRLGSGRAVGWIQDEVNAWVAKRIAERDAPAR